MLPRMKAKGASVRKIANALGVNYTCVRRILQKNPEGFYPVKNKGRTGYRKWRTGDYEAILDRMRKQKRTITDVCNDPDLPCVELLRKFKAKHPEFEEKYRRVVYSFPYPIQIRLGLLSPGLIRKCPRMRSRGCTHKEIGDELGVSRQSAANLLLTIKRNYNHG